MRQKNTLFINKKLIILIGFLFFLISGTTALAQSIQNDLTITTTPQFPDSYEDVSFELTSSNIDLQRSNILWYVDGELVDSSVGVNDFSVTTGSSGEITNVDLVIKDPSGNRFDRRITLTPIDLDILWYAHTYTPPFYKGKSLATSESIIKFSAISNLTKSGKKLQPSDLVYTWIINGVIIGSSSGVGKDSVAIKAKYLENEENNITLSITSIDSSIQTQKTISVKNTQPNIILYESNPLEGVSYNKALGDEFTFTGTEVTLYAEPYFFSIDDMSNDDITYSWEINNYSVGEDKFNKNNITLRNDQNLESGSSIVSVSIENFSRFMQLASIYIYINFN